MEPTKEPSKTMIYVSNLPFTTTDEQFKDLFQGLQISNAYIAKRKNGKSKGFGFVNFAQETEQAKALERLNGKELESRKLIVKVAFNDNRRNEQGELKEEFKTLLPTTSSDTVVYINNLEWSITNEELKEFFSKFNPKSATIATRNNGKSKGFGFIEFSSKEDQQNAISLDKSELKGRSVTVKASVQRGGDRQRGGRQRGDNQRSNSRSSPRRRRSGTRNNYNNRNRSGSRNNNYNNRNRSGTRNNNNNRSGSRNNNNNRSGTRNITVNRNTTTNRSPRRQTENTLYVSNLPFELDDNDLQQVFSEFNVKSAHVIMRNGRSRGYGFVEFNNSKDQNEALKALDQSEINERVVTVKLSTPQRNNTERRNYNNNNNRNNDRRNNDNRNNDRNDNRNDNRNRRNYNNNRNENNEPRVSSKTSVHVSNLEFSLEDNDLAEVFKGLNVVKAYVVKRGNGRSKGFGFVDFKSNEDQVRALKLDGNEIKGRPIKIQSSFEKSN